MKTGFLFSFSICLTRKNRDLKRLSTKSLFSFAFSSFRAFVIKNLPHTTHCLYQDAFDNLTAQTLYSGMPEIGSRAALVNRLAAAAA
jgi:hypothetical protein